MMSQRFSRRAGAIAAGLVLLALVVAVVLLVHTSAEDATTDGSLPGETREQDPSTTTDSGQESPGATSPLVPTSYDGEVIPPKNPTKTSSTADTVSAEAIYLAETRRVVETNADQLRVVTELVTEALKGGDGSSLEDLFADDEGDPVDLAERLLSAYPPIGSAQPGTTVNVFSTGETTVYFAYAVVTWTDGGLVSEHTIPIMLRFIDGEWRLSVLGDTAPDLVFVQAVTLP
jgi:hypothetical protein